MEMGKKFRMNRGNGDASYVNNSRLQETGITMTKEILEESISDLCNKINFSETLRVVDLGCSSGPNTLLVASIVINTVTTISRKTGRKSPEIQFHLNDLPSNDFNTLFILTQDFQENSTTQSCYFTGVPGSFYKRLFPKKNIHFFHCSYSLHWLSKLPDMGKIVNDSIPYSESVTRANYEQFQKDFLVNLRWRSEEVVDGGQMVLSLSGRRNGDPGREERKEAKLFVKVLEEMSYEGHIDEEKVHSFRIPVYTASPIEIEDIVEKEGSFTINLLQVSDMNLTEWGIDKYDNDASQSKDMKEVGGIVYRVAMGIRAAIESLVVNHFGEEIVDEIFMRYGKLLEETMSKEDIGTIITITISLNKKT